jgi:hypothetical protein
MKATVLMLALAALFALAPPAADGHCRNNICLWHGVHHQRYRHASLRYARHAHSSLRHAHREAPPDEDAPPLACPLPRPAPAWAPGPDPTGWPGPWVRARGFAPVSRWRF